MTDATETAPLMPYALYRYFDVRHILLYVGITGDLAVRDSGHIARSRWMQLVASSTVERHPGLDEVKDAERAAIESERPLFNKVFNSTPEARARLRAYLEEIGRLDLLYAPRTPVVIRPEPELVRPRIVRPEAFDNPDLAEYRPEGEARRARWERWSICSWWRPIWAEHGEVLEDIANMVAPVRDAVTAIGICLKAQRDGQNWPMIWVGSYPMRDEGSKFDRYEWAAHADFTFGDEESPPGLSADELAARQEFADALIAAGRCSSARIGDQIVVGGFQQEIEAQFAAMVLRYGNDLAVRCTARLRGEPEPDPEEAFEIRARSLAERLRELRPDDDELLRQIERLLGNKTEADEPDTNYKPAA